METRTLGSAGPRVSVVGLGCNSFGWLLSQEGVASVIAGATKPEQILANVKAGEAWRLTPEEMEAVPSD